MKDVGADRRKAAVQSMFRVRASESPPGPDGMRTVWHQGGEGADLTSTVDAQGRVVRQEFALFGEYLLWVAETGAATGRVRDEKAAGQVKGSDLVARDAALDEQVLSRDESSGAGGLLGERPVPAAPGQGGGERPRRAQGLRRRARDLRG
jgi:hypothetical protein